MNNETKRVNFILNKKKFLMLSAYALKKDLNITDVLNLTIDYFIKTHSGEFEKFNSIFDD